MTERERFGVFAALTVGIVLRASSTAGMTPNPDAFGYVDLAGQMSWLDPWRASAREPLWIAFVKVTTGPFGYTVEALQSVTFLMSVVALIACVWALWQIGCRGWVLVAGTAAIALSERLINTAGQGTRETMAVLAAAVAVGLAARWPKWLPVLAALTLAVRWELGVSLMGLSALLILVGGVPWRRFVLGMGLAAVLMGPFIVHNAREYDDPLFHTDIHATFYANLERTDGVVVTEPLLPPEERIRPEIRVPMYRAPLISWGQFVADVVGPGDVAKREAKAAIVLPVDALRLGWLPWPAGAALLIAACIAAVRRRDRVVLILVGMSGATVIGYGMIHPLFDRRLISHLTALLVMLICAGQRSSFGERMRPQIPKGPVQPDGEDDGGDRGQRVHRQPV
jgi:hypothetical protein